MLKTLPLRIFQDFLMPSRLGQYEGLLKTIVESGYNFLTVEGLADCVRNGSLPPLACVLRIDVDTQVRTAREMFNIERSLNIKSTYYFRITTLDAELMREIAGYGSEVGFHYEELATISKRLGLRSEAAVDANISKIHCEFAKNIDKFSRYLTKYPRTIASHGDFANIKLKIPNHYAIDDTLRERYGIIAEAYDEWLNAPVQGRFADCEPPKFWKPCAPDAAIAARVPCIYILVHPGQWRASALENLQLYAVRIIEEVLYRIRT